MADNYIPTTHSLGAAAKKPGWHSRKNETAVPQRNARIHYETTRGAKNRKFEASERKAARALRTIQDQLDLIEYRFQHGKGESKREKMRLLMLLEKQKEMSVVVAASVESAAQNKKTYQRTKRS